MEVCLGLASSLVNRLRCLPVVVVMQATQHWARRKRPVDRRFFWPYRSARDALLDPLMRPSAVKVPFVFLHDSVQMSSAQNQDVVQTFSPQAAQEAFAYGVRFGCSVRCSENLNACSHSLERISVLVVVVTDHMLSYPPICRVPRHPKMHHTARA